MPDYVYELNTFTWTAIPIQFTPVQMVTNAVVCQQFSDICHISMIID